VLAPFFAALVVFSRPATTTAALLSAFATYAAGFLVPPFGALLFGRIGDIVGRKYTPSLSPHRDGRRDLRCRYCFRPSRVDRLARSDLL
jgi:MFS family permease